jgi:hypothetical protein
MANSKHLAKLREGEGVWNDWRKANTKIVPNLGGANLSGADLGGPDLTGADLSGADLSGAHLFGAELTEADLSGVNLSGADFGGPTIRGNPVFREHLCVAVLRRANLTGANLSGAQLGGADLTGAYLTRADLTGADLGGTELGGADLTGASIAHTTFGDNDLSDVKGLETVRHGGPSTIGIDTIYRSHGNIPLAFLRGAGVPDNFIEFMRSLTGKAIEFNSCFISYSTKDQKFAARLHADLQDNGVRCWFAPHNIQGGEHTIDQIDQAIRVHERLLLILSPDSMKSKWVETEIVKARSREAAEKKRVLFPVGLAPFDAIRDWKCFDSDTGEDLAREIRKFYIPDFSHWKTHDSYMEGLTKLLGGLRAKGSKVA